MRYAQIVIPAHAGIQAAAMAKPTSLNGRKLDFRDCGDDGVGGCA